MIIKNVHIGKLPGVYRFMENATYPPPGGTGRWSFEGKNNSREKGRQIE
jgi:hypothetical protein